MQNQRRSTIYKRAAIIFALGIASLLALSAFVYSPPPIQNDMAAEILASFQQALSQDDSTTTEFISVEDFPESENAEPAVEEPEPDLVESENSAGSEAYNESDSVTYDESYYEPESHSNEYYLHSWYYGPSQSAIDAGGIVEFYDSWYASHYYDEGAIFYEFEPGDIVHIDDRDIMIEGVAYVDYYRDCVSDIRDSIGWDTVVFQTCLGEGSECVIKYGREI